MTINTKAAADKAADYANVVKTTADEASAKAEAVAWAKAEAVVYANAKALFNTKSAATKAREKAYDKVCDNARCGENMIQMLRNIFLI